MSLNRKTVCLIGNVNVGKTAVLNTLCGRVVFKERSFFRSGTKVIDFAIHIYEKDELVIVDTPGWDFKNVESIKKAAMDIDKVLSTCTTGVDAFLYVIKYSKNFLPGSIMSKDGFEFLFGSGFCNRMIIIVTRKDEFDSDHRNKDTRPGFKEWLDNYCEELRQLTNACRVFIINNCGRTGISRDLFGKIVQIINSINQPFTYESFKAATSRSCYHQVLDILKPRPKEKDRQKINLLLIGKAGHGKSATGNSLLGCKSFKKLASATSVTNQVTSAYCERKGCILKVVDGPGLEDTNLTVAQEKTKSVADIKKAISLLPEGVDAFLLVYRFGTRLTPEEAKVLVSYKRIFGDSYMSRVILVITFGDNFELEFEGDSSVNSIHDWCKSQTGAFRRLYDDLKGRVVLMNNFEKIESKRQKQIDDVCDLACQLQNTSGRYTAESFKLAERERENMIQKDFHILREGIQEKLGLLSTIINCLSEDPTSEEESRILNMINGIRQEIKQCKNSSNLADLQNHLNLLERNAKSKFELKRILDMLDRLRNAEDLFKIIILSFFLPSYNFSKIED